MRRSFRHMAWLPLLVALFAAPLAATAAVSVPEIVVCLDVDRATRAPVGAAEVFAADVGQLYCFTRIEDAAAPTAVEHVWYRDGETVARVSLDVGAKSWRTWSSKRVKSSWTGAWEVKVLDEAGLVLASVAFRIEPSVPEGE